jgi:hypothetical protein
LMGGRFTLKLRRVEEIVKSRDSNTI